MRLLVMSDLHLEHAALELRLTDCDLVILAGDIDVGARGVQWAIAQFQDTPVLYVPGNHEYYHGEVDATLAAMRSAAAGTNVHILDRECMSFGNVRFLGTTLWTDFRLFSGADESETMWSKTDARRGVPDYDGRIRFLREGRDEGVSPEVTQHWHQQAVAWLSAELSRTFDGVTVVVTHHAPSIRSIPAVYAKNVSTPAYASHLDWLVASSNLWIHGHTHSRADYQVASCRVVCNPRGYESERSGFEPGLIIEV